MINTWLYIGQPWKITGLLNLTLS